MPWKDTVAWTTILQAYAQAGHLRTSLFVFETMPERNVVSWTAMISAFAHSGNQMDSIQIFHAMNLEGVKPDDICFASALLACNHVGLLYRGHGYFTSMRRDHGIAPGREHYFSMADILCRAGRLESAQELIRTMPFVPEVLHWGSLLNACKLQENTKIGNKTAKHLSTLDPNDAASHVLLSNLYASLGNLGRA
ncbi:hypothetical protein SELMODRAFT_127332 [Selaginella moellendorffii]|uniref:Pentacotripeptide-repeat region of PRORP domain-containing protein n=2 Tax=Selaginella moellendorffii TaxID=88036 RepID=D8SXN7_SELML|nr:hypothetical protein SELMODRAFT_127332 [Selaginella moellendorffii]